MSRRYRLSLLMGCPAGGVSCTGTCSPCRCGASRGGLPSLSPACPATALPCWVARLFWSLANPAFSFFSCPPSPKGKDIPPAPLPLRGRGRFFCFLMQGASPLASPALDRLRHLQNLLSRCPAGGVPPALPARRVLAAPSGGLPSLSPAAPAFSFLSCPLSPRPPSPVGKGGNISLFRRGLRPRHPRG